MAGLNTGAKSKAGWPLAWLRAERPLRLVRIRELLAREGTAVSYSTLRRYAQREFGFGGPRVTVRLADTPPGEEAQVDFGHVAWITDVTGQRRKLWALIVTLSYSRHMFVWPSLTQTVADVCEGLDEAWRFFGGVARRVVLDNASSMGTVPNAQRGLWFGTPVRSYMRQRFRHHPSPYNPFDGLLRHAEYAALLPLVVGAERMVSALSDARWWDSILAAVATGASVSIFLAFLLVARWWARR